MDIIISTSPSSKLSDCKTILQYQTEFLFCINRHFRLTYRKPDTLQISGKCEYSPVEAVYQPPPLASTVMVSFS